MDSIGERVGDALDELERYLASRGIEPTGPSLIRYRTVNMDAPFVIEVGWVTDEGVWIDVPYVADVLPEGAYATVTHVGPYAELAATTGGLLAWADAEGIELASTAEQWACRYELYVTDPVDGAEALAGTVEVCMLVAQP